MLALSWTPPVTGGILEPAIAPVPTIPADGNWLRNGDFEGSFDYRHDPYTGLWAGELEMGDGWDLWYDNDQSCPPYEPDCSNPDSYNRRPEYKRETDTQRVRSGDNAQKLFTTYGTHTAGFYQNTRVPPESWVRFSIWVWVWSSDENDSEFSFSPGEYGVQVGIDPSGGTDWRSADIQWSVPITRPDQWLHLTVDAYTASGQVSVWTGGAQLWPVHHNDSYWDDAILEVLPKAPAATATPSPTATPYHTPEATPEGYEPRSCAFWRASWQDTFDGTSLSDWGQDPGGGAISSDGGLLLLESGTEASRSTSLAWSQHEWPSSGDLRLSFRFAFPRATGYGVSIGLGSEPYDGQRVLSGGTPPWGVDNILRIQQHVEPGGDEFSISLLDGDPMWSGAGQDSNWHTVLFELRENTYLLWVDGEWAGSGVSYWRPQSLYLGNPTIVVDRGIWTEVALDDITLEICHPGLALPLVLREAVAPAPTVPPAPARGPLPSIGKPQRKSR